jgi:hypothetical protein
MLLLPALLVAPPALPPAAEAAPASPESATGSSTEHATEAKTSGATNTSAKVDTHGGRFRSIKWWQLLRVAVRVTKAETRRSQNECPGRNAFFTPNKTMTHCHLSRD